MKNSPHKFAYRLLLLAEVLTKIEVVALLGYTLKITGYVIIVIADANLSVKRVAKIMALLAISASTLHSSTTATGADLHLVPTVMPLPTLYAYTNPTRA